MAQNMLSALPGQIKTGRRTYIRLYLLALSVYALLAFVVLHPLIFYNGTHVAGFDYFNYNWNFWWIRHAMTTPDLNVYLSDFVFFPAMNNFGYHALTAFWYPLWALIEPVADTLTAMNVIIFTACILNGFLLFVLLRREGVSAGLALIGGAALQITPLIRYFYYNTHINLMDWFWLPGHILLWQQTVLAVEGRRWRWAILWAVVQGVGLWGVLLSDLQFPIFVSALLVPYGLVTLWRSHQRAALIAVGVVTVVVAGALAWFAGPLPYILQFAGTLAPGVVENRPGIPFPRGYLSVDPVWWYWETPTLGGFVTIALLVSVIVGVMRWGRLMSRWRWLWFVLLLPPLILSMGPTITLFGVDIPMPFRILYAQTNGMFGMPWRLAPIFLVAAIIFIGLTWTPLVRRIGPLHIPALAVVMVLMFVSLRMAQTAPLDPTLPDYSFYEKMGRETGEPYDDYVVLEVPTGVGTGEVLIGDPGAISFQFYGMTHGKRMVNGFVSRAPVEDFWYIRTDDPLLSWLGQRRFLEPEVVEAQLREIIPSWPVGYIVIHQDYVGRESAANREIIGYFNSLPDLLCPMFLEGDALVYRTTWHPDGCPDRRPLEVEPFTYQVDLGSTGDEFFTGWGWYWPEQIVSGVTVRWTGEYPQADLYVDLPPDDYELTLLAQAFAEPRALTVLVDDEALGTVTVDAVELETYTLSLPAALVGDGRHLKVTLAYDDTVSPAEAGIGDADRQLGVMVDLIRFAGQ